MYVLPEAIFQYSDEVQLELTLSHTIVLSPSDPPISVIPPPLAVKLEAVAGAIG